MKFAWCLLLAACSSSSSPPDVVGPFTGEVHRYYLDDVTVSRSSSEARTLGDDLNGDNTVDNQLGATLVAIAVEGNDITTHARDILAASTTHSTLEIQADDLMNDKTVGVTLRGTDDDAEAVEVGGRLAGGTFVSNRTAHSDALGATTLHLPVLIDADPSVFVLRDMEVDLKPDGAGGYNASIRGLVGMDVVDVAAKGMLQTIDNNPGDHAQLISTIEAAHGGPATLAGIAASPVLAALLQPDVMRDGKMYLSFGFGAHFAAAPPTTITDTCHDRIRDGNEVDVDCGGSCMACAGGATCTGDGECLSHACHGTCSDVSCTDGVRDGIETDTDCGGWQCGGCASGRACLDEADCASGHCRNDTCE